jgi:hypothetical protein
VAEPLTAEDQLDIIALIADYAFRVDSGDVDGYTRTFAPDGVFEGGSGRHEGADAIRAYVQHLLDIGQLGQPGSRRHVIGIPSIRGDRERCYVETPVFWPGPADGGGIEVARVGVYLDEIVRVDGAWRFAKRAVRMHLVGAGLRNG